TPDFPAGAGGAAALHGGGGDGRAPAPGAAGGRGLREGRDRGQRGPRRGLRGAGGRSPLGGIAGAGGRARRAALRSGSGALVHVVIQEAGDLMAAADPRFHAAWQEWLRALATDADAALAAAHVYRELEGDARDALLTALAEDTRALPVPKVAIFAPLLAVESDPGRRARIELAIGGDVGGGSDRRRVRALRGIAPGGARVLAL